MKIKRFISNSPLSPSKETEERQRRDIKRQMAGRLFCLSERGENFDGDDDDDDNIDDDDALKLR